MKKVGTSVSNGLHEDEKILGTLKMVPITG